MISAELFKLRNQRTPWMLTAVAIVAMCGPAVYFLFRPPSEVTLYTEVLSGILGLAGMIVGAIFGGWVLGHEYAQSTLQRVATLEPRRSLLLGKKLAAGIGVFAVMLATALAVSGAFTWIVAVVNGHTLVTTGLVTSLIPSLVLSFAAVLLAFGLSAVTRSSTYSMLTVLVALVMFEPLLGLIPKVGPYTPGSSIVQMADWAAGVDASVYSAGTTGVVAAALAWIIGTLFVGSQVFARRDI